MKSKNGTARKTVLTAEKDVFTEADQIIGKRI